VEEHVFVITLEASGEVTRAQPVADAAESEPVPETEEEQ
jgi:hypothetical protein